MITDTSSNIQLLLLELSASVTYPPDLLALDLRGKMFQEVLMKTSNDFDVSTKFLSMMLENTFEEAELLARERGLDVS